MFTIGEGKEASSHLTPLLVHLSLIPIGFGCPEAPPTLRGRSGCCQQEGVDGGGDYHTRSVFLLPLPCTTQLQEGNGMACSREGERVFHIQILMCV